MEPIDLLLVAVALGALAWPALLFALWAISTIPGVR